MQISASLEVFSQMSDRDVHEIYTDLKKETKKVTSRDLLETKVKNVVRTIALLKWHLGLETQDAEKDMSGLTVNQLRDIHQTMRQTLVGARTRKQKLQKIARMMQVVDYFLQF